jgi:hypothetical protein
MDYKNLIEDRWVLFEGLTGYPAVPWLKRSVAGLSPQKNGFAPGSVHVGFVVDKVALGQVLLRVLRFFPVNITPPLLHTHGTAPWDVR